MPTSYTSLLGLALPVTGELSGVWGDTVNDYITQYLDGSVAGTQTISGSQTAVTLSKTTGSALTQVGSGSTGSSQYSIINCTGNPASLLTITAPAASKPYIVINATSTNQQVKLVGAGPTAGVTFEAGERAVVAWNGSDFVKIATSTADGVTSISFGSTGLTPSTTTTGAVTVAGTLATGSGGTGLTSFTANGVVYASSTSALTTGSALTFDGTNLATTGSLGVGAAADANHRAYIFASGNGIARLGNSTTDVNMTGVSGVFGTNVAQFGGQMAWSLVGSEQMRLTSTGLGIGTSSPGSLWSGANKLVVGGGSGASGTTIYTGTGDAGTLAFADGLTGNDPYRGFVQYLHSTDAMLLGTAGTTKATLDSSGNLGLGVTPSAWGSAWRAFEMNGFGLMSNASNPGMYLMGNAYYNGTNYIYKATAAASNYTQTAGEHKWFTAPSGTAGNAISFTQAMTLDASGNLGIGTTSPGQKLVVSGSGAQRFDIIDTGGATGRVSTASGTVFVGTTTNHPLSLFTNDVVRATITAAGFTQPVAYADTVVALGNTGTATTINLQSGNVFTATLTGNCTFTLSNPIATGASSFTLILTNDGTAGRTVAWSGGSFRFPGGAGSLSRTTTANATDIWVFFTPDGGTTWYGSIPMKNMTT